MVHLVLAKIRSLVGALSRRPWASLKRCQQVRKHEVKASNVNSRCKTKQILVIALCTGVFLKIGFKMLCSKLADFFLHTARSWKVRCYHWSSHLDSCPLLQMTTNLHIQRTKELALLCKWHLGMLTVVNLSFKNKKWHTNDSSRGAVA